MSSTSVKNALVSLLSALNCVIYATVLSRVLRTGGHF